MGVGFWVDHDLCAQLGPRFQRVTGTAHHAHLSVWFVGSRPWRLIRAEDSTGFDSACHVVFWAFAYSAHRLVAAGRRVLNLRGVGQVSASCRSDSDTGRILVATSLVWGRGVGARPWIGHCGLVNRSINYNCQLKSRLLRLAEPMLNATDDIKCN